MFLIETTFNTTMKNFELLKASAKTMKIGRSRLVELLIRKVMDEEPFDLTECCSVKYQLGCGDDSWYHCHVVFDSSTYENCLDLRKYSKLSVSAIIAYAIEKYLDELLCTRNPKVLVDNYHHAYLFSKGECDGVKTFVTFWGVPGQEILEKYLL
ncbi:MAG: hypothetical protein GY754_04375 [bacterium]|nr:hypothetical protein [bacterium]